MTTGTSTAEVQEYIQQMDPYEVETLVAQCWEDQGYETKIRKSSGDRGIDVEAYREKPADEKVVIQVKRYSENNKLGSGEVRKYATLHQQVPDADSVVLVTSGEVTSEAIRLAKDLDVKLLDGESLAELAMDQVAPEIDTSVPENSDQIQKRDSKDEGLDSQSRDLQKKDAFPWFDYSEDEWNVPCPYCGNGIHNDNTAFIEHWATNSACSGPNFPRPDGLTHIDKEEWASVRQTVDEKSKDGSNGTEWDWELADIDSQKYPDMDRTPPAQFPWIKKFGDQERLTCPYCDKQVGNTKQEFLEHWNGSLECSGPSTEKPSLFEDVSFGDWIDALLAAGYTESVLDRMWKENNW